jgi:hypothetical protein
MNTAILVGVAFAILCSSIIVSVEAKGITFKDYTDPYQRYSIQYPSKWTVQSEPVHTENNYLYEVPFQVGNNKGSSISVYETEKDAGLSLKEYASFIQNNVPVITTKVIDPLSCVSETVCYYFYAATFGFSEVAQMLMYYSGVNNKVFVVSATFGSNEQMDTQQFYDMENTFSLLQDAAVTKSNNYATITKGGN